MPSSPISRRAFIKLCAASGVTTLLASCGGAKITTAVFSTTIPTATPIRQVAGSATARPPTLATTTITPTPKQTHAPASNDIVTISAYWQDPWVRNFNPFHSQSLYTYYCIYEPLMIYNARTGELIPWLATGYQWGENNQTLTLTLRKGVQWSDGEPFGAKDVASTFKMLMDHPDISGIPGYSNLLSDWLNTYVSDISTPDAFRIELRFQTVNTLAIYRLATVSIVPKHIWGQLPSPKDFVNPDPVGTGPFTEVTVFEDTQAGFERILQLERNPYYWQESKPYIQGVRISYRHEDKTLEDLAQGKLDWASIEIPDIQKKFLDIDPSYFEVLADTYYMNFLQLNTSRPPFDIPEVRKAISMGIDRQQIVDTISQGYVEPANATGLGDRFKSWWSEAAISAGTWVETSAFQANALLDNLGFKKGADGTRMTPEGKPMVYQLLIESGYPDQGAVAQIISLNLANLGVVVSVSPTDAWWDAFTTDDYDMALFSNGFGLDKTPYGFYFALIDPASIPLSGAKTNMEAGRYFNAQASSLLEDFIHESDPARQQDIMDQVQMIYVEDAPSIPLYPNFYFIEYNTLRFTGFPSTDDLYAEGLPGDILVLVNLKPR